ncbi:hypothetical protein [Microbispora bryophytorum]|uniref:hypothetical protein n=1 Tax=Microbispora bryophytorum TaxID=1460882 RepID=UPI0033FAA9BE
MKKPICQFNYSQDASIVRISCSQTVFDLFLKASHTDLIQASRTANRSKNQSK